MTLLLHHTLRQFAGTHHDAGKGIEQATEEQQTAYGRTAEAQGMLAAVHLGHNLAEQQQEEGQQHRHAQKLQPPRTTEIDGMAEEIAEEHDNGDVHQIVGDKDGSQRTL